MLPRYDYLQSEPQLQISRSKSPGGGEYQERRNPLYVLQVYISAHSRTWLILAILSIQIFLLASLRSIHFSLTASPPKAVEAAVGGGEECSFGKVFVYDLPPMFNKDLVDNCESLNPWNSRCGALSNEGFGRPAGDGLAGMVPERLRSSWYWTDQFASEIIYHRRVLGHPCRTLNPSSATAFYVPFYGGLAVGKYLWSNYSSKDRDFHCRALLKWLQLQDTWRRSDGWDHFMMLGRITWDFRRSKDDDWGGSFLYMPEMQNVTRLLIERNPWDEFDVGVPYPTGFHPKTGSDLREWQTHVLNRNRSTLFGFAGATRSAFRDDFRGSLLTQCRESAGACRSVDCSGSRCSNGTSATMALFLDSKFCLQPRGDSFTRRSIFDCMVAGGIPVFFWRRSAYVQYTWHLPEDPTSYSVFIDRREVKNGTSIKMVLEGLGEKRIRAMREKVVENIPKLVYAAPKEGLKGIEDAFDVAINGVLRRFQKQQGDET